jgi:hypothetical protein
MERAKVTKVDGAAFADDLAAAMKLVPDGSVEMIMSFIEAGEWPEPSADPDAMDAWLEHCRLAGAGDFRLTSVRPSAFLKAPAAPPRPVESEADFLKRLSQIRADAEARHGTGPLRAAEPDCRRPALRRRVAAAHARPRFRAQTLPLCTPAVRPAVAR